MRSFLFAGVTVLLASACAASQTPTPAAADNAAPAAAARISTADAGRGGRIRPPGTLACDRNHLTSYTGVVSGYRREPDKTWLEISTDEDTVEAVTVEHAGQADASAHYLFRGQAFSANDWARIESSKGKLVDGMRVTAWVCDDDVTPPVIDWQPPGD